ncbi:hypothetical protein QFC22_002573 [Naganishia vaughanmartiniae]|uniref:Uncharacterized protein n=1 Tax=Naganishia vaughanmartiniae TaxID=1424756 RepID=A0ACC2XB90_9TREE|nr:hypothetical protein QFC22_002573 [Naganishia vaughanmartiniae]
MVYPALLPLLNKPVSQVDSELLSACIRVGPLLVLAEHASVTSDLPATAEYYIDVGTDASKAAEYLAQGAAKIVIDSDTDLPEGVSRENVILRTTVDQAQGRPTHHKFGGLILTGSDNIDASTIKRLRDNLLISPGLIFSESGASTSPEIPKIVAVSRLSMKSLAFAFTSTLTSDRPDGLFPTIVCAAQGASDLPLGLVYSSVESVTESIITGRGVYQSRKHGLWRKGETSGSTQQVVRIRKDCDNDAVMFEVEQSGTGFCHLETEGCFSDSTSGKEKKGIAALEDTLKARLASAPEGSYTARLFNDSKLLQQKIMEEAEELVEATDDDPRHVAFEAADLLYFTMVRCIKAGVTWADVERSLDEKAVKGKKGERRQGDAKPKWVEKLADKENGTVPAADEKVPGQAKESTADAPVPKTFPTEPTAAETDAPIRMRTSSLASCSSEEKAALLKRPVMDSSAMIERVKPIVNKVRDEGDAAVRSFTQQFDRLQVELKSNIMRAPFYTPESVPEDVLPKKVRDAIDSAYANLKAFHVKQAETKPLVVETMPGVVCTRFARPIDRVGIYVPGGTAILPSTALHLGVPAQVAGCSTIVLSTPPRQDGSISPEVLYVAQLVGVSCILKAGGAQAVAAMAYGTEECPKVDKIFGPGNQWVTAAKMLVQNDTNALVGIDMPAGPSEVMVIADKTCNPVFVASDLLSQAEHGIDSQVVLVAIDLEESQLEEIEVEVDRQARALPRVDIIKQAIKKSLIVKTSTLDEAMNFSNEYAPEHLILHLEDAPGAVKFVNNAGSVFVGAFSPESCGDYASGTNHTLPTYGYARQFSGVNTLSFQKHITSQELTKEGLRVLGPIVVTLAEREGLEAHANAVRVRLAELKQ